MDIKSGKGKVKLAGLVRDRDGNPLFNDYNDIPEMFLTALSNKDWDFIEQKRKENHAHT